jgi:hypothetical protein
VGRGGEGGSAGGLSRQAGNGQWHK